MQTIAIMEDGQGTRKSDKTSGKVRTRKSEEIATTPARELKGKGAVTPGDQPTNEREQQSSKKKREEIKTSRLRFKPGMKGIVDILSETGHKLRPLSHDKQIQLAEEAY